MMALKQFRRRAKEVFGRSFVDQRQLNTVFEALYRRHPKVINDQGIQNLSLPYQAWVMLYAFQVDLNNPLSASNVAETIKNKVKGKKYEHKPFHANLGTYLVRLANIYADLSVNHVQNWKAAKKKHELKYRNRRIVAVLSWLPGLASVFALGFDPSQKIVLDLVNDFSELMFIAACAYLAAVAALWFWSKAPQTPPKPADPVISVQTFKALQLSMSQEQNINEKLIKKINGFGNSMQRKPFRLAARSPQPTSAAAPVGVSAADNARRVEELEALLARAREEEQRQPQPPLLAPRDSEEDNRPEHVQIVTGFITLFKQIPKFSKLSYSDLYALFFPESFKSKMLANQSVKSKMLANQSDEAFSAMLSSLREIGQGCEAAGYASLNKYLKTGEGDPEETKIEDFYSDAALQFQNFYQWFINQGLTFEQLLQSSQSAPQQGSTRPTMF